MMTYSDRQVINLPSHWYSDDLSALAQSLAVYDGQDYYAHPFRQSTPTSVGACVLVLLTNETVPRLLLTKRASHLSSHQSEIAFVGGHRDKSDQSSADTALREAFEEVGLPRQAVNIIGYLPIQTAKSGKAVRPVVAVVDEQVANRLVGSACEIERILWVNWAYFVKTPPQEFCLTYDNKTFVTPCWRVDGETVWGLTGRIIANLLEIGYDKQVDWYYRPLG